MNNPEAILTIDQLVCIKCALDDRMRHCEQERKGALNLIRTSGEDMTDASCIDMIRIANNWAGRYNLAYYTLQAVEDIEWRY